MTKTGTFCSGTRTRSPDLGFLANRGALRRILNAPKPRRSTDSPCFSAFVTVKRKPSITASVSSLVRPVAEATWSTISDFLTVIRDVLTEPAFR